MGIFWLASYPKSGNTWLRIFLANLLRENTASDQDELDINRLSMGSIGSSREWVQEALGFEISELSHDEVDSLRPEAYRWIAKTDPDGFHKIHDAYTYLPSGEPLIPLDATRGAIYLVRNPLDIAISYAHHVGLTLDEAVEQLCSDSLAFCDAESSQSAQLRQILMSWSEHVESWINAEIPQLVIRYEDLLLNSLESFTKITDFLDLDKTDTEIQQAINLSTFELLQKKELAEGFSEKLHSDQRFFRKGVIGDWQGKLSDANIEKIMDSHADVMRLMGYLNEDNSLSSLVIGSSNRDNRD